MENQLTPSGQIPCKSHFSKNPYTPFNSRWFRFQQEIKLPRKWYQLKGKKQYVWNCWDCWFVFITNRLIK